MWIRLLVISYAAAVLASTQDTSKTASGAVVTVASISARQVLIRDMRGSYAQHAKAAADLIAEAKKSYRDVGHVIGIYPDDPDVVAERDLQWQLAIEVGAAIRQGARAPAPYRLARLPDVTGGVINTTMSRAALDGLSMLRWMPDYGFVQVAPTRMEYLSTEATPNAPVRIIVPVRKRASGLKLVR